MMRLLALANFVFFAANLWFALDGGPMAAVHIMIAGLNGFCVLLELFAPIERL